MTEPATRITFSVRYELGHTISETWEQTRYHCPSCGEPRVWVDVDAGDYYEGPWHLCMGCGATFTMPRLGCNMDDWQNQQRRDAIHGSEGHPAT